MPTLAYVEDFEPGGPRSHPVTFAKDAERLRVCRAENGRPLGRIEREARGRDTRGWLRRRFAETAAPAITARSSTRSPAA